MSALCCFPNNNNLSTLFSIISSSIDNRINIYDSNISKLILQCNINNHLKNNIITCIISSNINIKNNMYTYILIGMESGEINLWNISTGILIHSYNIGETNNHIKRITSLVFHPNDSSFYSASMDKSVIRWGFDGTIIKKWANLESIPTCLSISPDGNHLLIASAEITVYDISTNTKITEFIGGHVRSISSLCYSSDSKFIFSCDSDRFISVWTVNNTKSLQVISLDFNPIFMTATNDMLLIVGKENVQVHSFNVKDASKKKIVLKTSIICNITLENSTNYTILAAYINDSIVRIASGSTAMPNFDSVEYKNTATFEIPFRKLNAILDKKKSKKDNKEATTAESTLEVSVDSNAVSYTLAPISVSSTTTSEENSTKKSKKSKKSALTNEPSLEEKLAIASQADSSSIAPYNPITKLSLPSQPQADSLQTVLVQALHTSDNSLLEYCLSTSDLKVIQQTVDRLPAPTVITFLTKVIDKLQAAPNKTLSLVIWIKEILTRHTVLLLNTPGLSKSLTLLYSNIESRLGVFRTSRSIAISN